MEINITDEQYKVVVQALRKFICRLSELSKKFVDAFNRFCKDNHDLIELIGKRIKYQNKIINRQRLYEKRRALGRRL